MTRQNTDLSEKGATMRMYGVNAANEVANYGELQKAIIIGLTASMLAVSDPDACYITGTSEGVFLFIKHATSGEKTTMYYPVRTVEDFDVAAELMTACKPVARVARRVAIPEGTLAALAAAM